MKGRFLRDIIIGSLFAAVFLFFFLPKLNAAKIFSLRPPTVEEITKAVTAASKKTGVRAALLYGLLGQETGFGRNLGKTDAQWGALCANRNTQDCRNWKRHDCKKEYINARFFDDILKRLGFVDERGNADKGNIPISSTCAMGFTQFEPNTWWLLLRGKGESVKNPWDLNDAVLMAAYYLEELGADGSEALGRADVIGKKDRIALQKYYCGGASYFRRECVEYALSVESKSKTASSDLLRLDLENQLELLRRQQQPAPRFQFMPPPPRQAAPQPQDLPPATRGQNIYAAVRDGAHMYLVGRDSGNRWRIEKRSLTNGVLEKVFGIDGVVTADGYLFSPPDDMSIAVDAASIYVVGSDNSPTHKWRTEKRSIATGERDGNFGNKGAITGDEKTMIPKAMTIDSTFIYIAGYDSYFNWRIEKRLLLNGMPDFSFGAGGSVVSDATVRYPQDANIDFAIIVDGPYLYIGGSDYGTPWRIEKRFASTGVLDQGFGKSGIVREADPLNVDFGAGSSIHAMAIHSGNLFAVGGANNSWRIEKRYAADGGLDPAFGKGGVIATETGEANAADAISFDSNHFYIGGSSNTSARSRIEKRTLATGAFDTKFGRRGIVESSIAAPNILFSDLAGIYVGGSKLTDAWIIEKRSLVTGAVDAAFGSGAAVGAGATSSPVSRLPSPDALAPFSPLPVLSPTSPLSPFNPQSPLSPLAPILPFSPTATSAGSQPVPSSFLPPTFVSEPPVITTTSTPSGIIANVYRKALSATGKYPPFTWSIASGTLPDGLTLDESTGVISGTPVSAGTFSFAVTVTDNIGSERTSSFTIDMREPMTIATVLFPPGTVGSPYGFVLAARGGMSPYVWELETGALPEGLRFYSPFSSVTEISGTPTRSGISDFSLRVKDAAGASETKTVAIEIRALPLVIEAALLPDGTSGILYGAVLSGSGGVPAYTWGISSGNLPQGLSVSPSGVISGIPVVSGTFSFVLQLTDSRSTASTRALSLSIYDPLVITTAQLFNATSGSAYSAVLAASGGVGPYTWDVASGSLPLGLSLEASLGVISGIPSASTTATFIVRISDAKGRTNEKTFGITVQDALSP